MQKQIASADPPRVKVRKISPRSRIRRRIAQLIRDENAIEVEPGTSRQKEGCDDLPRFVLAQTTLHYYRIADLESQIVLIVPYASWGLCAKGF